MKTKTKKQFTAEVNRLLEILTHSVYSNREIFLRELISNSSDACDKLRYISSTQKNLSYDDLEINLHINKDTKQIVIIDNGIGMNRDEMIENLGTIAKSGTKSFIDNADHTNDISSQIGQFGIGFYSAFIVAKKVNVISRKYDSDEVCSWSSDGLGSFSIDNQGDIEKIGTKIILDLKEDSEEFLEIDRIKDIVSRYSDNINFPIYLTDGTGDTKKQVNTANAIWTKQKSDIKEEQYQDHYQNVSKSFDQPIAKIHYKAEGRYEYDVLLYIPSSRPFDLFDQQRRAKLKLYVKRVLISEDTDIIPAYLRFVSGIIDSADIPLTVSREVLQENQVVIAIKRAIKNRIISTLQKISEDEKENYQSIWDNFGSVIKEGLYEDYEKQQDLLKLIRFNTTKSKENKKSLEDYIKAKQEKQKSIYYITSEDYESAIANPILEGFKSRDIEVIIFTDPVDSFWTAAKLEYEKMEFKHVSHTQDELKDIPIKNQDKKNSKSIKINDAAMAEIKTRILKVLKEDVSDVKPNLALHESPACLSLSENSYDKTLQKILQEKQGIEVSKPVFEFNPSHKIIDLLSKKIQGKKLKEVNILIQLLYDYALIMDGEKPKDIARFGVNLQEILTKSK
tara:strand:+ start:27321 stop:29183 length:1863 start_codon:yes stop_codon:yes gene_type:complete